MKVFWGIMGVHRRVLGCHRIYRNVLGVKGYIGVCWVVGLIRSLSRDV